MLARGLSTFITQFFWGRRRRADDILLENNKLLRKFTPPKRPSVAVMCRDSGPTSLQPFFRITDCSASLSRLRSATSFRSFVFSSRNCFASCARAAAMVRVPRPCVLCKGGKQCPRPRDSTTPHGRGMKSPPSLHSLAPALASRSISCDSPPLPALFSAHYYYLVTR